MGLIGSIFDKAKDIGEGIKNAFTGAGDGIATVINSAKGQIPPEYVGEIAKIEATVSGELHKLEIETEVKMAQLAAEAQKQLYDFSLQYEGTATQVPKWILVLRSIIRPVLTIIMFTAYMIFVGIDLWNIAKGTADYEMIQVLLPNGYWVIFGLIIGFWFGGRAGENIADKLKNKAVK